MNKPNYNAETQTGVSDRGIPFSIQKTSKIVLRREVVNYDIRAARGGVIVCDSLDAAIERAKSV